jgi:hypothetical protein
VINSWDFVAKLGLTELTLCGCSIPKTSMVESATLKQLGLSGTRLDPRMLTRCKHLEEVRLSDDSAREAFRKVLPHVTIK